MVDISIKYVLRQLAIRAGVECSDSEGTGFEGLEIDVIYSDNDKRTSVKPRITVLPSKPESWQHLVKKGNNSLRWIDQDKTVPHGISLPFSGNIPVMLWGASIDEKNGSFIEEREDGWVVFNADIIAATFLMLTRWEETITDIRDDHGRFPATASIAYKQGFLDIPVVDYYAQILREWLKKLLPNWKPKKRKFEVLLSHDIDHIQAFPTIRSHFQTFVGDLLNRKNFSKSICGLKNIFHLQQDPYIENIFLLAALSKKYNLNSDFYFMAASKTNYDEGYNIESHLLKPVFETLQKMGFRIGLHPSYYTFQNTDLFHIEKMKLEQATSTVVVSGRQHYLRFDAKNSWKLWNDLGFQYDSTVGYADYEGFRCGTCIPFHPFDVLSNKELRVVEIPLIVMDATLQQYRSYSPELSELKIREFAKKCKEVDGVFTLLWHNTSINWSWEPWFRRYVQILEYLSILESKNSYTLTV